MNNLIRRFLNLIIYGKEGETMVAMLWVVEIVHKRKTFADVPKGLKEKVRQLLIDGDCAEFITED